MRALQELVQRSQQSCDLHSYKYKDAEGEIRTGALRQQNERQWQLLRKNGERCQDKYDCADQKYQEALRELRNEQRQQHSHLV